GGVDISHTGPYGDIPAQAVVRVSGLDGPVDIVTDKFGVPHVYAQTIGDAVFGQGYVMAADRLPQMNLFRHFASGTVSELFGLLDPNQIDADLRIRMHMFRPLAEQTYDMMKASSDPTDKDIVTFLSRFSDGVNQYLGELKAGQHLLDNRVATF